MGYALGIDLGTSFTVAAVALDGRTEVVGLGNHAAAIPSVVFLRDDGDVIIGDVALRRGQQEPDRIAREFKRRFGDSTPIMLGHTPYSAERLMAAVLQQVAGQVAERYGSQPDAIAIAHPANWGPYKIELLQQAAQLAGLVDARFVTEPEAAAVHFAAGARVDPGDVVAVYDLGGGTFDAALLRRTADGFETMGEPQGIERLGGIDFDEAVLSHVRSSVGDSLAGLDLVDPTVRASINRLRDECVAAKEALSEDSETSIQVMLPNLQTHVRLTRNELEDAIRPTLRETVESLRRAIAAAGVTANDVKTIVLSGGSSRIPLVTELVGELGRPIALDAHPKHTVALGAARLAAHQASSSGAALPPPPVAPPPPPAPAAPPPPPAPAAPPPPPAPAAPPPPPAPAAPKPRARAGATGARARTPLLIGAAVVAVVAIAGFLVLRGGDSDKAVSAGSSSSSSNAGAGGASSSATQTCSSSSGRCVFIDTITEDAEGLVVAYSTVGYEPQIQGDDSDHHIHFFFDTVPVEEAGVPGAGPWTIWDFDSDGKKLFHGEPGVQRNEIPNGATQLCAVVATHGHALDADPRPSCKDLP